VLCPLSSSDSIGEPKKAPCVSCHFSGSECIVADSRRGGNFRHKRATLTAGNLETLSPSLRRTVPENVPLDKSCNVAEPSNSPLNDVVSTAEQESGDVLAMELRNPSDALQILARSGETQTSDQSPAQASNIQNSKVISDTLPRDGSAPLMRANEVQHRSRTRPAFFDDYELVQRGLLRPSLVSELLST
jgi:hypothetical protein